MVEEKRQLWEKRKKKGQLGSDEEEGTVVAFGSNYEATS